MEIEIEDCVSFNFHNSKHLERTVPILPNSLNYYCFFADYIFQNKVCLIKNVTSDWICTKKWFKDGKINFPYLSKEYGSSKILLYHCQEKYFNSQKTEETKFDEFLTYWENFMTRKDETAMPVYYLKDWHLRKLFPNNKFYEVPYYFASDWLNEYLIENSDDDYCFVYMGPKDSWTPFHSDVFNSFSWSANVSGKKKWLIFPAGNENNLKDSLGNLPYDLTELQIDLPFHYEIIQNTGDVVFVPSGWYHQVWNLEDTISVNHNWINGCNVENMWISLQKSFVDVKKETEDCLDMDNYSEHCQLMLKACFGINFLGFYKFLLYISKKRIKLVKEGVNVTLFEKYNLGYNHAIFDLLAIKKVLELALSNNDFVHTTVTTEESPTLLLDNINNSTQNVLVKCDK